jgi:hypothetical protein
MDGQARTISAQELYAHLGTAAAPAVVDVRKRDDFDADDRLIVSAVRYDIDANLGWLLPAGVQVVVYCAHGGEAGRDNRPGATPLIWTAAWPLGGHRTCRRARKSACQPTDGSHGSDRKSTVSPARG